MPRYPLSLSLLLAAAACTGGAPDAAAPDTLPVGQVEVTGTVRDSLLGTPVVGLRVFGGSNGALAITDDQGSYHMLVNQEPSSIRVSDVRYAHVAVTNPFTGPQQIDLRLVRFAPAILSCSLEGSQAVATVVDLQGRKTVDRRMTSHAVAASPGGPTSSLGYDWLWYPVDNFTWTVLVPLPPGTDSLVITVADADLNSMTRPCNDSPSGPPAS